MAINHHRFFNTSGPIVAEDHYSIDPLSRVDWEEIQSLIDNKRYFVLHAPRQTGKTTALLAMMAALNSAGKYAALYVNIEAAQAARGDVAAGIKTIINSIARSAKLYLNDERLSAKQMELWQENSPEGALEAILSYWAQISEKPIVLMLDEVDALVGDTLISLLRQIRAGYAQRPNAFPQSLILCGVRDVRDYRMHTANQEIITGGSAFNIKAESLRIGNFNVDEVNALFAQHTSETGQTFANELFPLMWEDTRGQPWLVNALGYEMTWKNRPARDRTRTITVEDYNAAREALIQSRATHLDQLADKLREERVRAVFTALMAGEQTNINLLEDDLQYVEDLGLIRRKPQLTIANKIYQEIIPREITSPIQDSMVQDKTWYIKLNKNKNRFLDIPKLLTAFQQFYRENADIWLKNLPYKEAAPHLLMQAFLQRIVNGGGRINREYALGRKRTDLLLEWPVCEAQGYLGEVQRVVIELKLLRKSLEQTLTEGLTQTADYVRHVGAGEGYLIIFNRDAETSWDDKIWQRQETEQGLPIGVWGM